MVQYELIPKLIMKAAALGLLGAVLKSLYDDIPEYDKTNYFCIPLGRALGEDDDRVVYVRLVPSGFGGIAAGIFWKTLGLMFDENKEDSAKKFAQALDYAGGQMPGLSPGIELGGAWFSYLTGHNPYDAFYGSEVIPDTEFKAGWGASIGPMVQWTAQKSGTSQYTSVITNRDERDNWFEAAIRHTPGINSIIKISDRGFVERVNDINARIEKESAKEKLKRTEIFEGNRDRLKTEDFKAVFEDVKNEFFGAPEVKTKKDRSSVIQLRGQFLAYNLRESDVSNIIVLMRTPTVEGRARILAHEIRPKMNPDKFEDFKRSMFKYDVISREVLVKMKELDKENTNDNK